MTSSKSTQIITDKLEQKNEYLEHGDVKDYFKPWSDNCKLHAFLFEFEENSNSNPTSIIYFTWSNHSCLYTPSTSSILTR